MNKYTVESRGAVGSDKITVEADRMEEHGRWLEFLVDEDGGKLVVFMAEAASVRWVKVESSS